MYLPPYFPEFELLLRHIFFSFLPFFCSKMIINFWPDVKTRSSVLQPVLTISSEITIFKKIQHVFGIFGGPLRPENKLVKMAEWHGIKSVFIICSLLISLSIRLTELIYLFTCMQFLNTQVHTCLLMLICGNMRGIQPYKSSLKAASPAVCPPILYFMISIHKN